MNIKDILSKVTKGEKLSDDESKALQAYDPQKDIDAAAAAARRKAEQDKADADKVVDDLKTQMAGLQKKLDDAGKGKLSEAEQAKAAQEALQRQIADLTAKFTAAEQEKAKLTRQAKVDAVIRSSGIKFVDGIDANILMGALASSIGSLKDEDLGNPDAVKPLVEAFKNANKAVIADTSGHGAGSNPGQRVEVGVGTGKPIDQMTPAERQADLKKRGII